MDKPNCYQCKHRRNIPGDCHSSCVHPGSGYNTTDDVMTGLFKILARGLESLPVQDGATLHVTGDPHGIKNGWFLHPINFDPTWLLTCDGFEVKGE